MILPLWLALLQEKIHEVLRVVGLEKGYPIWAEPVLPTVREVMAAKQGSKGMEGLWPRARAKRR